jgi:hypothetical protein
MALFKAEDDRLTDALVVVMVGSKADRFVTSDNAVHRFEDIKYFSKFEILLRKTFPNKYISQS